MCFKFQNQLQLQDINIICILDRGEHSWIEWEDVSGPDSGGYQQLPPWCFTQLTCSESCLPLRKKPSRQPMTTASTDRMSSPFCLQTFFTRPHTSSKATAILLLHHQLLLLVPSATSRGPPQRNPPPSFLNQKNPLFSHIEPTVTAALPKKKNKPKTKQKNGAWTWRTGCDRWMKKVGLGHKIENFWEIARFERKK